jgi:exopolysaccharide production protein ExoQ
VKLFAAYAIFAVMLIALFKREGLPKLPPSLYAPLIWVMLCLSRSLTQWLQFGRGVEVAGADAEGSTLDAVFLSILILIGLRTLYKRRLNLVSLVKSNPALFALYGFALLSVVWADFPLIVLKRWTKWSGSLVLALVVLSETDPKGAIKALVKRSAYILIPLSVIFIKFVPSMGRAFTRSGSVDFHGVATQKNDYGVLLLIFGIYFAWELIGLWRRKDLPNLKRAGLIDLFFLGVVFWQLFFIDSKTPILCLLLAIGIIFLIGHPYFKGKPKRVRNAIIALVLGAVFLQYFADIERTIISSAGRNPTLTDRTLLWGEILKLPMNPWLGTGWDNFWMGDRVTRLWEKWWWHPRSAHNGYIETYLYLGWAGIGLLVLVLLSGLGYSVERIGTDLEYGSLALAFFFAVLFQNYAESTFHRMSPLWFFFLLFTLVRLPGRLRARAPDVVPAPS